MLVNFSHVYYLLVTAVHGLQTNSKRIALGFQSIVGMLTEQMNKCIMLEYENIILLKLSGSECRYQNHETLLNQNSTISILCFC